MYLFIYKIIHFCSLAPTWYVYESDRAAETEYYRLGGLNNGNLFSHSFGGWKSKIKTGLVAFEGLSLWLVDSCLSPVSSLSLCISVFNFALPGRIPIITLLTKVHLVKAMEFPGVMYGCESWTAKKAEHWRIDAFELWCWRRLLRVPWTAEIKSVHPKGNQSWILIGITDAEAEAPILRPPDVKNWLIWKDPDAGKDWRQEEKGTTEDEMVGCYRRLDGHEFEQALGVGEGQGRLACCGSWGRKESETTEWLNWTESYWIRAHPHFSLIISVKTLSPNSHILRY